MEILWRKLRYFAYKCRKKTEKKYRLSTEAEWEYAARGGTQTSYFFVGEPDDFSNKGFLRKFFDASVDPISKCVVYAS